MSTPTLDETDRDILKRLRAGPREPADLATDLEGPDVDLDGRLAALEESGLVAETGGAYELTDSGRRVIDAPGDTTADDRIDVPDHVERAIAVFGLPPERAAAVRSAFAFLAYWGEATGYEIKDAIYSERPAGYGSATEWWDGFVRAGLADLPDVASPPADGHTWRYERDAGVEDPTEDGRHGPGNSQDTAYASVKHALEALDLADDERAAVHAAFARLTEGDADDAEIKELYDDQSAGFDSVEEWWECVRPALDELPGVVREGGTWRYRNTVDDTRSPGGGSHIAGTEEDQRADEAGAGGDDITAVRDDEDEQ